MLQRSSRTIYGGSKYAAFHLLLARWLRHHCSKSEYRYVTLGGTELRDCQSLHFIDPAFLRGANSCEEHAARYSAAVEMASELQQIGTCVLVQQQNIFNFQRKSDLPHFFFFDFEGTCSS